MRHLKSGRTLGRNSTHRVAMLKNMLRSLVKHGRVRTTLAKAKEIRPVAERFVTLGKKGSLAARRHAFSWIRNDALVAKLFSEYADRFASRAGGYTRITRLGFRVGDAAQMAMVEFLPGPEGVKSDKESTKETKGKKKETKAKVKSKAKAKPKPKTKTKTTAKEEKDKKSAKKAKSEKKVPKTKTAKPKATTAKAKKTTVRTKKGK